MSVNITAANFLVWVIGGSLRRVAVAYHHTSYATRVAA
jgi:hypothetical protein